MGCGVCVAHCPQEAVSLVRDPSKGEPLEIRALIDRAGQVAQNEKGGNGYEDNF